MNVILQFLFGLIQSVLPDIISNTKQSLTKENVIKFLDVDKDGDFDIDDLKAIKNGKILGTIILIGLAILILIFQLHLYNNLL